MANPIRQVIAFNGSAKRIYEALLDARQFSQFTGGAPAQIDAVAGGAFSCFGGMIAGRIVELKPDQRIVQAWRAPMVAALDMPRDQRRKRMQLMRRTVAENNVHRWAGRMLMDVSRIRQRQQLTNWMSRK